MRHYCSLLTSLALTLVVCMIVSPGRSSGNYVHAGAKCEPAPTGGVQCNSVTCLVFKDPKNNSCNAVRCDSQTTLIMIKTCRQDNNISRTCTQAEPANQTVDCGGGQGDSWAGNAGMGGCGFQQKQGPCMNANLPISCGTIPDCTN